MDAADPVALTRALVACRSVTPEEGGALTLLASVLSELGFAVERMTFSAPDTPDVENLLATIGTGAPHLAFCGHSDVVPAGEEARWTHPPFAGAIDGGKLYGRGAVDMKGGIACFIAAAADLFGGKPPARGSLSLLITGDEEGPSVNGTAKLLAAALAKGHRFDAALVGEPTSRAALGDTIKVGRRGSISGTIHVDGRQGHVAYPHQADNPVPKLVHMLEALTRVRLDEGSAEFEPSNLEVVSIDVGNPAFNVIPASASARFNVRFNDRWTTATVEKFVREALDGAGAGAYGLAIQPGASESFLTRSDALIGPLAAAIEGVTGLRPEPSTNGGTSDARFFKGVCPAVEFGLVSQTIHQVDEHVAIDDLHRLTTIYRRFLEAFLAGGTVRAPA